MILLLSGVMPEFAPYEPHVAVMTLCPEKRSGTNEKCA
jgi:hypothetical protein